MDFLKYFFPLVALLVFAQITQAQERSDEDLIDFNNNYLQLFDRVKSVEIYEKRFSGSSIMNRDNGEMVERRDYYKNGTIASAIYYENYPNEFSMFFFEYDSTSLISCTKYAPGNDKEYKWVFTNDSLVTQEIMYRDNGKVKYKWIRAYNEDHEVISQKKVKRNGKVVRRFEGEVDTLGRVTNVKYFKRNDKLKEELVVKYKDTTDLVTSMVHYKKHELMDRVVHQYDDEGNLIVKKVYNGGNNLSNEVLYNYDSLGRVVEAETINGGGETLYTESFIYDTKDNVLNHSIETTIGLGRTVENEYNAMGDIKFRKIITDTGMDSKEVLAFFEYDDNGNLIEERTEHLSSDKKFIRTHEYFYYKNPVDEQSSLGVN